MLIVESRKTIFFSMSSLIVLNTIINTVLFLIIKMNLKSFLVILFPEVIQKHLQAMHHVFVVKQITV